MRSRQIVLLFFILFSWRGAELHGQTEKEADDFQSRLEVTESKVDSIRSLIGGIVVDQMTGRPIKGALIGPDAWHEGKFGGLGFASMFNKGTWEECAARTDSKGLFVGLSFGSSVGGLPVYPPLQILVRAEGYVPLRVNTKERYQDQHLGYGFSIELERYLKLNLQISDPEGVALQDQALNWLLLHNNEPFQEGNVTTNEEGILQLSLSYFSKAKGLSLHLWNPTQSIRIVLDQMKPIKEKVVHGQFRLGLTPVYLTTQFPSPEENLQEMNIGLQQTGCRQQASYAKSFELTAISLTKFPGAPTRQIWDGTPQKISGELPPGKFISTVRLDRKSYGYQSFDAKRGRLDIGPMFGRWIGSITKKGSVDQAPFMSGTRRLSQDNTSVISSRRSNRPRATDFAEVIIEEANTKDIVTIKFDRLDEVYWPDLYFLKNGQIIGKHVQVKGKIAQVSRQMVKLADYALIRWEDRSIGQSYPPPALMGGPLLFKVISTSDKSTFIAKLVQRIDRLTFRCTDQNGKPMPQVILWFRGTVRSRGTGLLSPGKAPWGFALEASTGLPHVTLMTDSKGHVHLRDVPVGKWTLELISNKKSLGLRHIEVTKDSKTIVLTAKK